MPRVTTLRRCSSAASAGVNDSQTSASIRVSALPGSPDGKVPVPATCRSPSSPLPAIARAASTGSDGSPAAGGDVDRLHHSGGGRRLRRLRERERDVERGHGVALLEHPFTGRGRRVEDHPRGHAVADHRAAALLRPDQADPRAWPS